MRAEAQPVEGWRGHRVSHAEGGRASRTGAGGHRIACHQGAEGAGQPEYRSVGAGRCLPASPSPGFTAFCSPPSLTQVATAWCPEGGRDTGAASIPEGPRAKPRWQTGPALGRWRSRSLCGAALIFRSTQPEDLLPSEWGGGAEQQHQPDGV